MTRAPKRIHRLQARAIILVVSVAFCLSGAQGEPRRFRNPVIERGADPWVTFWKGHYYLCQSRQRSIWVSKSARLLEIGKDSWTRVWRPPLDKAYSQELWAPELHYLRGKWWIYVAADDGDNAHHRMYVLEGDPENPQAEFAFKGKIAAPTDRWAIDGTVLQMAGDKLYFVWSGWKGTENVAQHLYIAPMSNPWTISGDRVLISSPGYDWEKRGEPWVNEGPQVLRNGSKLFLVYSASGSWTDDYCLGLLTFTGDEVLDPKSWRKSSAPVFEKTEDVYGPGHCSFVKSRDGREDWIIYHSARHRGAGWNRQVNMQRFGWAEDGSPVFGRPIGPDSDQVEPSGDGLAPP